MATFLCVLILSSFPCPLGIFPGAWKLQPSTRVATRKRKQWLCGTDVRGAGPGLDGHTGSGARGMSVPVPALEQVPSSCSTYLRNNMRGQTCYPSVWFPQRPSRMPVGTCVSDIPKIICNVAHAYSFDVRPQDASCTPPKIPNILWAPHDACSWKFRARHREGTIFSRGVEIVFDIRGKMQIAQPTPTWQGQLTPITRRS